MSVIRRLPSVETMSTGGGGKFKPHMLFNIVSLHPPHTVALYSHIYREYLLDHHLLKHAAVCSSLPSPGNLIWRQTNAVAILQTSAGFIKSHSVSAVQWFEHDIQHNSCGWKKRREGSGQMCCRGTSSGVLYGVHVRSSSSERCAHGFQLPAEIDYYVNMLPSSFTWKYGSHLFTRSHFT